MTLNFETADAINYHSVVVMEPQVSYPAVFEPTPPVFEGAETSGAHLYDRIHRTRWRD